MNNTPADLAASATTPKASSQVISPQLGPKVYLAGPITGLSYAGSTDWRDQASVFLRRHGVIPLSPMRNKEYLSHETSIGDGYPTTAMSNQRAIMTRDRHDVFSSDLTLMYLAGSKRVSIGTVMEAAWCDAHRKPIVVVMEEEGNPHDHVMMREAFGFRVTTLDAALQICVSVLGIPLRPMPQDRQL